MNLVAEIAHEQYSSALFIHDPCTCESTCTSSTDNIDIIQATLNGVTVNSDSKHPNQPFDFRSSTTDSPLQVIIGDFKSQSKEWRYRSTKYDNLWWIDGVTQIEKNCKLRLSHETLHTAAGKFPDITVHHGRYGTEITYTA